MGTKTNVHTALNSAQTIWTVMVYKTNLKLGFVVVRCWIVCVWLVGVYSVIIEFIYTHLGKKTSRQTENCISFRIFSCWSVQQFILLYEWNSQQENAILTQCSCWKSKGLLHLRDGFKWKFLCAICPSHSQ